MSYRLRKLLELKFINNYIKGEFGLGETVSRDEKAENKQIFMHKKP